MGSSDYRLLWRKEVIRGGIMMYSWKVVPLCEKQLRDVDKSDILKDGLYRRCKTYKSGGGYDKFSNIYRKRSGVYSKQFTDQFVVQLYGCPLKCPYCYVTDDGVNGNYISVDTDVLVNDFVMSGLDVFHLMGGAPALYIDHWVDILKNTCQRYPFHSDMLLVESLYDTEVLKDIARYRESSLFAVSVKGADHEEFLKNTGVEWKASMFWQNLENLCKFDIPFYMTFTGMSDESIEKFKSQLHIAIPMYEALCLRDSFKIDLVHYAALD